MSDTPTPTPGQVAYEGYMAVHLAQDKIPAIAWGYAMLEPHERDAWEAAAEAVLALERPTPESPHVTQAALTGQALLLDLDPEVQREDTP